MFPNDINKYYNLLIYTRIELNCIQAIPNFGSFFVLKMETSWCSPELQLGYTFCEQETR